MKATGLLDEKYDVRHFVQVNHEDLKALANSLKGSDELETVRNVYRFNVREIQYPFRADGKPAVGFEFKAFPWLVYGFFKFYFVELSQEYAWLLPSQLLKFKYGICSDTANLCTTLCRILGVDAYTVLGVVEGSGRYYGHAWTIAKANNIWYLLETTIHKGRPPLIRLEEVDKKLQIHYLEVARYNEKEVHVNRELWDKYNLTMQSIFKGVELD
ncbi:MAG: transglutaminase-like domain-containing protein [Nitrososphaerota archaeon]